MDPSTLENLPISTMIVKGKFTLTDGHNWISQCLPDVPQNANQEDATMVHNLYFRSTFVGTLICIELKHGQL